MITYVISDVLRMLKKHKLNSFLMIFLLAINFVILGVVGKIQQESNESANNFDEVYGKNEYFYTSEGLSDGNYYQYLDESNDREYAKLMSFKEKLEKSEKFNYAMVFDQSLEVYDYEVPEVFLYGYEDGNAADSVYENAGKLLYYTKAVEVNDSFFEMFNIIISEGRSFETDDYSYSEGKIVPILLGNAYKGELEVGDVIKAKYLFEEIEFKVKGFVSSDTYFLLRSKGDFESCERYIIIPALNIEKASKFSKTVLLQQMYGIVESKIGYQGTLKLYQEYMQESGLKNWEMEVVDPDGYKKLDFNLKAYSEMTDEVANQFRFLLAIVLVFSVISISVIICGFLKENIVNFGIELLCGGSFLDITIRAVVIVSGIVLLGDIGASAVLCIFKVGMKEYMLVHLVAISTIVSSCTACICYIKSMSISDIIGGKE